ncbi:MAG: hypothetical protein IPH26_06835 [Sterolibacteriaceae bacterium]|uniref:Uncharacterized protein n=1 Tax=Candidatus Methylophosphatis roskildensis TaxID=2899263 RepID=A0A9D7HLG6_9PROT|nr:hypothetical protein [Candidatus Methylophosphatis roskildensis]
MATLRGSLGEANLGRLVVLREAAGLVTDLVGSEQPVFAWLVHALGSPIVMGGQAQRTLYVADADLVPVGEVPEVRLRMIIEAQNETDFDAALAEAAAIIDVKQIDDKELASLLEKAAEQAFLAHSLALVATPVALREMGFRSMAGSEEALQFKRAHAGVELRIDATADWLANWRLTGISHSARHAQYSEKLLPNEVARGKVFLAVLQIWREAFGNAGMPECLELAVLYERHQASMNRIHVRRPVLTVDPKVFRAILRWMQEQEHKLLDPQGDVTLAFSDGLLRLATGNVAYGCAAWGDWVDDCVVVRQDLLALSGPLARARQIRIEQAADHLGINGLVLHRSPHSIVP